MNDTEKKPETEPTPSPEPVPHSVNAEDDLSDLELPELPVEAQDEYSRKPKLKEFLRSPDSPSRYLMVLAFFFAFLAVTCFSLLIYQTIRRKQAEHKLAPVIETIVIDPVIEERVGEFKVSWPDGELRVDVVVRCSSAATCEEVKTRNAEVRDRLLPILQNSTRAIILDPAKKLFLRQELVENLNKLGFSGKITELNFTDLTVEAPKPQGTP